MNFGTFNSNGSLNLGPFSPVWADAEAAQVQAVKNCIDGVCNASGGLSDVFTVFFFVVGGILAFTVCLAAMGVK